MSNIKLRLRRNTKKKEGYSQPNWNIINDWIKNNISFDIGEYVFPQRSIFGSVLKMQIQGIINYEGAY